MAPRAVEGQHGLSARQDQSRLRNLVARLSPWGRDALPSTEIGYSTPDGLTRLEPDKADNYEIGIKGTLQERFRYSAAVFDIQWHNIQEGVQVTPLVLPLQSTLATATAGESKPRSRPS